MQSSNNHDKQQATTNTGSQQNPELSEAWRALLGLQSSGEPVPADPATQVQSLASDPWSSLVHAQGMQPVDLQKVRLHDLHPAANDDDVEHALDLMQEADSQSAARTRKTDEI